GHNGIRTTGLPNATLLRVEILQHLLVGPVDPRLEVITGVAGTVATGAESIVPAGSYCVLTIVRNSTSWVISSDRLTLRTHKRAKTRLCEWGELGSHQLVDDHSFLRGVLGVYTHVLNVRMIQQFSNNERAKSLSAKLGATRTSK